MIGILGSGQLAKMLSEAARGMGIQTSVLAQNSTDPAVSVADQSVLGNWEIPGDLTRFVSGKERVIFENEFVPEKSFRTAGFESESELFEPRLSLLYRLQDKWQQKLVLNELRIPTSDAQLLRADFSEFTELDSRYGKGGWVLKWTRMGYDGKGTFLKSEDHSAAAKFIEAARAKSAAVYAEKKVSFVRELAMLYARNRDGDFLHFPLVISEQRAGICFEVIGPATAFGVSKDLEARAADYGKRLGDRLGLTGAYAIEFFEAAPTEKDLSAGGDSRGLWVNEIAPRVHNSAHYSQDAASFSQFHAHLAMALGRWKGKAVKAPTTKPFFGMLNLIGSASVSPAPKALLPKDTKLVHHDYGKQELRPGRKMAHLNFFADSKEDFEKLRAEARSVESSWQKNSGAG